MNNMISGMFPNMEIFSQSVSRFLLLLTQSLHLLHHLLPDGLDVDAAEAPVGGDLDQVGPPEAAGHHLVDVLVKVQRVLAVGEVAAVLAEGEAEEGPVEVKVAVVLAVVATVAVRLSVVRLSVAVIGGSLLLAGQDLMRRRGDGKTWEYL